MRNTAWLQKWLPWLVLFCLVGSRVILVAMADPLPGDDGNRYLREAVNMWLHGTFSDHATDSLPTAHDLPLFPALLTGLIAIFRDPTLAAKVASLLNCVLFGVAARGVYTLAVQLTASSLVGTSSMLVLGFFPGSYPHSVFYMPESLFLALFVACLVAFVAFLQKQKTAYLMGAFLLWGISILAKPISLLFGVVMGGVVIAFALRQRQHRARQAAIVSLGLLLGGSVFVPWIVRNDITFGVVGLSSITGTNPFHCNYLFMLQDMGVPNAQDVLGAKEAEIFATIPQARDNSMVRAEALGSFARQEIAAHFARYLLTVVKRHPGLYASTGVVDTLRLFGDTEGSTAMEKTLVDRGAWRNVPTRVLCLVAASWLLLLLGYGLTLYGLMTWVRQRDWIALAIIVPTLVYFAILIGPVTSTRYRFVMLPAFAIAASVGLRQAVFRLLTTVRHNKAARVDEAHQVP